MNWSPLLFCSLKHHPFSTLAFNYPFWVPCLSYLEPWLKWGGGDRLDLPTTFESPCEVWESGQHEGERSQGRKRDWVLAPLADRLTSVMPKAFTHRIFVFYYVIQYIYFSLLKTSWADISIAWNRSLNEGVTKNIALKKRHLDPWW